MGEIISYVAREVTARGLDKQALPDEKALQVYLFHDDYAQLALLKPLSVFSLSKASMLYPGAGVDILFPLLYVEHLFPALQQVELVLVDIDENRTVIKTILDDIGISFAEEKQGIAFYWRGKLINVKFMVGDIFRLLPTLPRFDIYFERAFRIMKEDHPDYEHKVVEKLNASGIVISDSGFQHSKLRKIEVSQGLSAYKEMVMGVKE